MDAERLFLPYHRAPLEGLSNVMTSSFFAACCLPIAFLAACHKVESSAPSTGNSPAASSAQAPAQEVSPTQPAAPSVPVADAAPAPAVQCSSVLGRIAGDKPGSAGNLPSDFPPVPGGSTLCGETFLHEVWYLNTSAKDEEVLDYYRKALTAQGYTVDPVSKSSGGGQRIDFTRTGVIGYIATNGEDRMAMKFKDIIKIAYHKIPV
jgi:hypothetical protein